MMKPICVDGGRPTDTLRRKRVGSAAHGTSFADELLVGASDIETLSSAQPTRALSSILPVEVFAADGEQGRRREARQHGASLLDRLDELRSGLLNGRIPAACLASLTGNLGSKREACGDAELERLIAEIELRAEVELAKMERRR
jgi:hypothetical protein